MRSKRTAVIIFLLLAGVIAVPVVLTWRQVRREQLNHDLIAAVDDNDTARVRSLLRQGADPNARALPADTRSIWQRIRDMVRQQPRRGGSTRESALMRAAEWTSARPNPIDNVDTIKALVDAGAEVNFWGGSRRSYPDWQGPGTPLLASAYYGKFQTMKLLLAHKADVNLQDPYLSTALMLTASHANAEMVEALLATGADVNAADLNGRTPLMYAIEPTSTHKTAIMIRETVACLLRHGASTKHVPYRAVFGAGTLVSLARRWNDRQLVQMLKMAGAKDGK